jgi:hypothetical protein
MAHHTHLVKTRLTVEQDEVAVLEVALDDPAILQERVGALVVPEVDTFASVADDVAGARVLVGAVAYELLEVGDVVRSDCDVRQPCRAGIGNEQYLVLDTSRSWQCSSARRPRPT